MPSLLNTVTEKFTVLIQKHFEEIGNKATVIPHVSTPEKLKIPAVLVYSSGFTSERTGMGGTYETGLEGEEQFSGDGKQTVFELSENSFKPIRKVMIKNLENKFEKRLSEGPDFTVDYEKKQLTFFFPPPKGNKNLTIKYDTAKEIKEVKVLKLNSKYFFDSWAINLHECNILIEEIIKGMLLHEENLLLSGIKIAPPEVTTIDSQNLQSQAIGRRASYSVELDLVVEKVVTEPEGIIKKIRVKDQNSDGEIVSGKV